jgi:hypothetical protein
MSEVIDWDEAMQQCGDDEEFLRELLGDLRDETDAQMVKIDEIIRVSSSGRKEAERAVREGQRSEDTREARSQSGGASAAITAAVCLQFDRFYSLSLFFRAPTNSPFLLLCFALFSLIQNPVDAPFVQIMRAAHVIKGASSNLMCAQLRFCSMNLETAASAASNDPAAQTNPSVLQSVQVRHQELQVAVQNYHAYLQSVGV